MAKEALKKVYVEKGVFPLDLEDNAYGWYANFVENGRPPKIDTLEGTSDSEKKALEAADAAIAKLKAKHGMKDMGISATIE